jgi:hypothetical protein
MFYTVATFFAIRQFTWGLVSGSFSINLVNFLSMTDYDIHLPALQRVDADSEGWFALAAACYGRE